MKIDARQIRFCRSIACDKLKGLECQVDNCEQPDREKAIAERLAKLKEV